MPADTHAYLNTSSLSGWLDGEGDGWITTGDGVGE